MWSLRRSASDRSRLYLEPAELARKLVKELEADKVSRGPHVSVRNRYTVYLCREDYKRLDSLGERLTDRLELELTRHVRSKGYEVPGAIRVKLVADPDLDLGYFGIYGERDLLSTVAKKTRTAGAARPGARGAAGAAGLAGQAVRGPATRPSTAPVARPRPEGAGTTRPAAGDPPPAGGATAVIPAAEAKELGLARQTIVLKANNEEYVFDKGRVIVGRSRDVDFRIENADVSRRHAAFYWSEGKIMVKDLGSTNGTMVNGYPVDSTVVDPGDVVVVGDCFITVEAR